MSGISPRAIELHLNGDCWSSCPICSLDDLIEEVDE